MGKSRRAGAAATQDASDLASETGTFLRQEEVSLQHFISVLIRTESDEAAWKASIEEYFATPLMAVLDWELDQVNRAIEKEYRNLGKRSKRPLVRFDGVELT